jgi:hypothetical protein
MDIGYLNIYVKTSSEECALRYNGVASGMKRGNQLNIPACAKKINFWFAWS